MPSLKDAIRNSRARRNTVEGSADDIKAYMGEAAERRAEELFTELKDELSRMAVSELKKIAATMKKGNPGNDGKTIRGPRGPAGKSIRGLEGKQGKTGIGEKGEKGDNGKDGNEIQTKDILKKLNKAQGGLKIATISGLEAYLDNLKRSIREKVRGEGRKHGGGMTLAAGANITLTRNQNGTWTVASTASGGSNIATEKVNAIQSGSNVTIDLTQLAHTSAGVLFVSRNGQLQLPNGNAGLPGSSYSQSGTVVTVYNADAGEDYLIQYLYA